VPGIVSRLLQIRFMRFGLVGASGTVVNSLVLYFAQEVLLARIEPVSYRLKFSVALAILIATINNFAWNRVFTWVDRNANATRPMLVLFAEYCAAAGVAIAIQFVVTTWLAQYVHYLVGNLLAIVISSIVNYLANDRWTFRQRKS
jgi:putative flippase GtrA